MKKKTKIILSCVLGAVVLGGVAVVVSTQLDKANNLSGTVYEGWHKTTNTNMWASIEGNAYDYYFYSKNNDRIHHIEFYRVDENTHEYIIKYETDFSLSDDLQVYFVLDNRSGQSYTTPIETTHFPTGDYIKFTAGTDTFDDNRLRIQEVWVRTVD